MTTTHGKPITWNELADLYDKSNGRKARTLPMDVVFEWAKRQTDRFKVLDDDDGTLVHLTPSSITRKPG